MNKMTSSLAPSSTQHLPVFGTVFRLQQEHGLHPEDDYIAYRKYLSRKMRRVRVASKFTHSPRGRGFAARPIGSSDVASSQDLLLLPLLLAEHSWAGALACKRRLEVTKDGHRKIANHMVRRLRKAVAHSADFEHLCSSFSTKNDKGGGDDGGCGGGVEAVLADERTILEAHAYRTWMGAQLDMEREEWQAAFEQLTVAHKVCSELGKMGTIAEQDFFLHKAEDLEQSLRYCSHHIASGRGGKGKKGGEDGIDLQLKLDAVVAGGSSKGSRVPTVGGGGG